MTRCFPISESAHATVMPIYLVHTWAQFSRVLASCNWSLRTSSSTYMKGDLTPSPLQGPIWDPAAEEASLTTNQPSREQRTSQSVAHSLGTHAATSFYTFVCVNPRWLTGDGPMKSRKGVRFMSYESEYICGHVQTVYMRLKSLCEANVLWKLSRRALLISLRSGSQSLKQKLRGKCSWDFWRAIRLGTEWEFLRLVYNISPWRVQMFSSLAKKISSLLGRTTHQKTKGKNNTRRLKFPSK
jgi:hypothetical protein